MTRFTGPRMAIPTFKTPVETITPPGNEIFFVYEAPPHSCLQLCKGLCEKRWRGFVRQDKSLPLSPWTNGMNRQNPYKVRFLILKSFST